MSKIIIGSYVKVKWRRTVGKHIYLVKSIQNEYATLSNGKTYKMNHLVLLSFVSHEEKKDILATPVVVPEKKISCVKIKMGGTLHF